MSQDSHSGVAARIGSALANIAAGAATGGVTGAVAGAVKSFLPELMKLLIGLLVVAVLLPYIIICALPNILFGYGSSTAEDIIAVNNRAEEVSGYYGEADAATQERIDEIVSSIKAENTDEEGKATFDLVETDVQLTNITPNWFIAINSARHQQDLFEMNKPSILEVIREKIISFWSLIPRTIGEGLEAITILVLHIDIRDRTPEALMSRLGFTDEQMRWATAIHDTLEVHQNVDTSGVGGGYDFSGFTFSEVDTPVVYYNQLDARWCNTLYGRSDTIGAAGCGPTALAMVVATWADPNVTPVDVADWAAESGYCCEGHGSYHSLIPDGAVHYGLAVEGIGRDAKKLVEALERGDLVIAIMAKGHFTSGGHFITLRGVTADGQVLVADPASTKRSNQTWDLSVITSEARRDAGSGGPFWVISCPK